MKDQAPGLNRLLAAVSRIQRRCTGVYTSRPLRLNGSLPRLEIPAVAKFLPVPLAASLNEAQRQAVILVTIRSIETSRHDALKAFKSTISQTVSIEEFGGISDTSLEQRVCSIFEHEWKRHLLKIRSQVRTAVSSCVAAKAGERSRKGNGFDPVRPSLHTPDPSFLRCPL